LKGVGLGEDAGEKIGAGEVLIVAPALAGEQDMDGVVKVVTPDGIGGVSALGLGEDVAGKVLVGFDGDDGGELAGGAEVVGAGGDLGDDVAGRIVVDGLDGIEAQAIEVILAQPVEGVFDDEAADVNAAEIIVIDGVAPGSFVAGGEVRAQLGKIISLIAEVVVDDVEEDGEAAVVGGIDEVAKRGGTAVIGLHGVEADAIVAPVARAWDGIDGHEFDGGDAEIAEVVEALNGGVEGGFGGDGADVEFVEYVAGQGEAAPVIVLPGKGGIDDFGGSVNAFGEQPGDRVGDGERADEVLVAIAGRGGQSESPIIVGQREHGKVLRRRVLRWSIAALETDGDRGEARRPEKKVHESVMQGGAES
jgi:hypothetical protein